MKSLNTFILLLSIAFFLSHSTMAQKNLTDVNTDRFYELPAHLVKNKGIKVTSDELLKKAGLEIKQIGFRIDPYRNKQQLFIEFHSEKGARMQLGAILFGSDGQEYWSSKFVGLRQPLERNLFSVTMPFDDVMLLAESRLTIWAMESVIALPYEIWEWQDNPSSEWMVAKEFTPETLNSREVDRVPTFPGGDAAKFKFIGENLKYPPAAAESAIQGTVVAQFVVKKDGTIHQIEILQELGYGCEEAVINVLNKMPKWTPGTKDGQPVPTQMIIPFKFKL